MTNDNSIEIALFPSRFFSGVFLSSALWSVYLFLVSFNFRTVLHDTKTGSKNFHKGSNIFKQVLVITNFIFFCKIKGKIHFLEP